MILKATRRLSTLLVAAFAALAFVSGPVEAAPPGPEGARPISRVLGLRAPGAKAAVCTLPAPSLAVSPQPVGIPATLRETVSAPVPFAIQNTGTGNLVVSAISVTNPPCDCPQLFTVIDSNACVGASIPPGGSCTAFATFFAYGGTGQTWGGTIDIASNDPLAPLASWPIEGTIGASQLTVSSASLDFGATPVVPPTPVQLPLGVSNAGTVPVTVSSVSLFGAQSSAYSVVPGANCAAFGAAFPLTLPVGASCDLTFTFAPTGIGVYANVSAFVNFSDGSSFDSEFVALAGTGLGSGGSLAFAPASINFFDVPTGQTSFTQSITVTNVDSAALSLSGFAVTPPSPYVADFSDCVAAATLPPGGTCLVLLHVDAAGATAGSYPASLEITGGATTSVLPVTVAVVPSLAFNPSGHDFGDVLVGSPATFTFVLENFDPVAYSISLAPLTNAAFTMTGGTCQVGTVPASPGAGVPGTCTVDVQFDPSTSGPASDFFFALESTTGYNAYVNFSGNGISPGARLQLSPGTVTFPPGIMGSPAQVAVTATNVGDSPTPTGLAFVSDNAEVTVDPGTCAVQVGAGASCTFTVHYSRASVWPGPSSLAFLTVQGIGDVPPFYANAPVFGTTVASTPAAIEATPAGTVTFAPTLVGTAGTPVDISLGNTGGGTSTLDIASIVSSSPEFAVTTGCPIAAPLSAQACCLAAVTFQPTAVGTRNATLAVTTSAGTLVINLAGQGLAPSPPDVAKIFTPPSVQVGATSTLTVSLSNSNAYPLTNVAFSDAFPAGLVVAATPAVANTCGGTVTAAAGGTSLALSGGTIPVGSLAPGVCSVSVAVTGTGVSPGLVNTIPAGGVTSTETTPAGVSSAAASATLVVSASPVPSITVSPTALNFAAQTVGTISPPQALTVTSAGTAPLAISGVTVSGDYTIASTCTSLSPLAPAATCGVDVQFGPLIAGARAGQVVIASDDPAVPSRVVDLAGLGVPAPSPNVSLAPSSLVFPTTTAGQVSAPLSSTLTNTGGAALSILSVDVVGSGYTVSNNCGASVAAGASCTLTVVFAPPDAGSFPATARIITNSPGSPSFLPLNGSATPAPVGLLSASPSSLAFDDQIIGTTSGARAFTVTNTGDAVTSISGISATGDFAVEGSCLGLRPGESCAFRATFTPTALGSRAGQVVFTGDAANSPFGVSLSGTGVPVPAPRVQLSASSLGFGNALVGTATVQTVTVTNVGDADLVFGTMEEARGDFRIAHGCTGTMAPGQSCRIDVGFVPRIPGLRTGEVRFTTNAGDSPHRVDLAGTGCRFSLAGRSLALVCGP